MLLCFTLRTLASKTINIVDSFGIIHCASGVELNIPPGTSLELTDRSIGSKLIVKVPEAFSSVCEYGILKYNKSKVNIVEFNQQSTEMSVSDFQQNKNENSLNVDSQKVKKELKKMSKISSSKVVKEDNLNERFKYKKIKKSKLVTERINSKSYAQVAKKMNYASKCKEEFVNKDGIGDWGRFVKEELSTGQYAELLKNNKPFRNICPGFRVMNTEDKKNLWVFILMSMSHYESSCRAQAEAQGPNGIAKGLLQLHQGAENKYAHWDRERICKKGDSKHPKESLQCTLSMLSGQVERFNSIFFEKSYWDVLRNVKDPTTHASKIRAAIQMIPGCAARSVASDNSSKHGKKTI